MEDIDARVAVAADLPTLAELYRGLEKEMVELKEVWRVTEALPEPADRSLQELLSDPGALVLVASAFGVPAGFLVGTVSGLLPQAGGATHGVIRYIYTDPGLREIGVGEALMDAFRDWAGARGVAGLDAHVSPGHRLAKNFFESNGLTARHIVMHGGGDS